MSTLIQALFRYRRHHHLCILLMIIRLFNVIYFRELAVLVKNTRLLQTLQRISLQTVFYCRKVRELRRLSMLHRRCFILIQIFLDKETIGCVSDIGVIFTIGIEVAYFGPNNHNVVILSGALYLRKFVLE